MNYKALYRTYRPANFVEVEGQDHIVKTLTNLIKLKKITHAYLFSGPRGTGKTSVAKIFANVINCGHSVKKEVACPLCIVTINNSVDIIEIDAASNNGVSEIRELREKVKFTPTKFKYKVYIIDEVHMLTKGAFNALLKTLEEPPKHVVFILATTDPDKLPLTILSRVQRYNFKRINKDVIQKQVKFVFDHEKIKSEHGVIEMISSLANGSLRDALSIADQINAYSNSDIKLNDLNDIFGLTSKENQVLLLNYCADNFVGLALKLFDNLVNKGIDIRRLINSLINLLKEHLLYIKTNDDSILEEFDPEILNTLKIKINFTYDIIDILIILINEIKYSDIPQQLFQIAIIKICSLNENDNYISNTIKNDKTILSSNIDAIKTEPEEINYNDVKINEITDNFVIKQEKSDLEVKERNEIKKTIDIKNNLDVDEEFIHEEFVDDNGNQLIKDVTDILTLSNESNIDVDHVEGSILGQTDVDSFVYDTNEILVLEEEKDLRETESFNLNPKENEDFSFSNSIHVTGEIKKDVTQEKKNILTQPDIINLFLLGDKNDTTSSKKQIAEALLLTDSKFSEIISYLENCKIITSSKNFVLISSDYIASIDFLLSNSDDELLKDFMFKVFKMEKHIFVITKQNFLDSAELFKELKANDKLPDPTPLPILEKRETKTSAETEIVEAEKKGINIFGGIFNKRK